MDAYFVYILSNAYRTVLYVGISSNVVGRTFVHKHTLISGFTARYNVDRLVWWEACASAQEAIAWEKRLKRWKRAWKVALIEKRNPHWVDLYPGLVDGFGSGDPGSCAREPVGCDRPG